MGNSGKDNSRYGGVTSEIIRYVQGKLQELDPKTTMQDAVKLSRGLSDEYRLLKEQGPLYNAERREIVGLQQYVEAVLQSGNAFRIDRSSLETARRFAQRIDPTLTPVRSQSIDAVFQ